MSILKRAWSSKAVALLLLAAVILTVGGVTLAKYFYDKQVQKNSVPQDFYFTSNYEDGGVYYVVLSEGKVSFEVYNHNNVGSGQNKVTSKAVTYTVSYYRIDSANQPVGEKPAPITYTFAENGGEQKESVLFEATAGETYQVEIKSTAPYEKEIKFKLCPMEEDVDSYYTVTPAASGNWLQVDIYIGSTVPESITVNYSGLEPDNQNDMMKDWTTVAEKGVIPQASLTHHSHYTLIFFGDTSGYAEVTNGSLGTGAKAITLTTAP
ncbi:MAG: hypothetical protein IJX62_06010 [Clostridia bacterium]|nr:hypothetical protein [Clostridia bacterium]